MMLVDCTNALSTCDAIYATRKYVIIIFAVLGTAEWLGTQDACDLKRISYIVCVLEIHVFKYIV